MGIKHNLILFFFKNCKKNNASIIVKIVNRGKYYVDDDAPSGLVCLSVPRRGFGLVHSLNMCRK